MLSSNKEVRIKQAEKLFAKLNEAWDNNYTVYATNYLQSIKITPKNRDLVRLNGDHIEVRRGKRWESINGMKLEAYS